MERRCIGVDEVGRGCIAGDLVVCAFALHRDLASAKLAELRGRAMDSKAFASRVRRAAVRDLVAACGEFRIERASPEYIAATNIRAATLAAMAAAAERVRADTGERLPAAFDGADLPPGAGGPAYSVVHGDARVLEISCASILAKVLRDGEMEEAALAHPGYGFERHAGYATREHREAIARLGLSPIHRVWARRFERKAAAAG